jgi:hypothetical protein
LSSGGGGRGRNEEESLKKILSSSHILQAVAAAEMEKKVLKSKLCLAVPDKRRISTLVVFSKLSINRRTCTVM